MLDIGDGRMTTPESSEFDGLKRQISGSPGIPGAPDRYRESDICIVPHMERLLYEIPENLGQIT
jgi:hypothetical protein